MDPADFQRRIEEAKRQAKLLTQQSREQQEKQQAAQPAAPAPASAPGGGAPGWPAVASPVPTTYQQPYQHAQAAPQVPQYQHAPQVGHDL
jgi:hypothetical protein